MDYLVGLIIGSVLGLTGAGGSVFAVPLLIYLVHLPHQSAIGVSLGAVCISALLGVFTKLKSGHIQWLPAIVYSVVGSLFAPVGVYLNQQIPASLLMIGFSTLVLVVAVRLWLQASTTPSETKAVRSLLPDAEQDNAALCCANNHGAFKIGARCVSAMGVGAIATGVLSGLFGVGGGFLIVPTLIFLTSITIQQAVATSLVVISTVSLTGFVSFMMVENAMNFTVLGHVAVGGAIGMGFGVMISRYIAGPILQKIFSALMLLMALITVFTNI